MSPIVPSPVSSTKFMAQIHPGRLHGIYAITPSTADTDQLLDRVRLALVGGVAVLQFRSKLVDAELRRAQAHALRSLTRTYGVPLIVNDDIELALSVGADGVHLGETDGSIQEARMRLGAQALIGASCYDSLALAESAVSAGASYIAFGAFFPSRSKTATRSAHLGLLRDSARLGVPRAAIGGLRPDNIGPLVTAGVELLAVIDAIFGAADPRAAVTALRAAFDTRPSSQGRTCEPS